MFGMSWSGRLPRPQDLRDYDQIVPGAAKDLVDEILQESRLAQQSIDLDRDVSSRMLSIMESQHELETEDSRSDRSFRQQVFINLRPLLYLPLGVILVVLFAPIVDWVKAVICVAIMVAYTAPVCIVLVRGRMTDNESDVIKSILPEVTAAVTGAIKSQESHDPMKRESRRRDSRFRNGPDKADSFHQDQR